MSNKFPLLSITVASVFILGAGCSAAPAAPLNTDPAPREQAVVQPSTPPEASDVKEFAMDSFFVMADGKPAPQYSVKEIAVKKGDRIRLLINTKNGTHNINIDEFNVHAETPTGQVTTVEFTADKAGEFIYYCSMPGHRANGHWGTLKVTE